MAQGPLAKPKVTLWSGPPPAVQPRDEKGKLFFEVALGEKGEIVKRFHLKMGEGIAGWVAMHGEPLIVLKAQEDPRFFKEGDQAAGFVTPNAPGRPLRIKEG